MIDPRRELRRSSTVLRTILTNFVRGEKNQAKMKDEADRLLKLSAYLILSIQKIGPGLFRDYFEPISPTAIAAEAPKTGIMTAKEVGLWNEYEKRAKGMDGESFKSNLFAAVARIVKDLMSRH
jgi:hypothetical protein